LPTIIKDIYGCTIGYTSCDCPEFNVPAPECSDGSSRKDTFDDNNCQTGWGDCPEEPEDCCPPKIPCDNGNEPVPIYAMSVRMEGNSTDSDCCPSGIIGWDCNPDPCDTSLPDYTFCGCPDNADDCECIIVEEMDALRTALRSV